MITDWTRDARDSKFVTRLSDWLEASICQNRKLLPHRSSAPRGREFPTSEVHTARGSLASSPPTPFSEQLQASILRTLIFTSLQTLHRAVACSIGCYCLSIIEEVDIMFSLARSANRTALRNLRQKPSSSCSTRNFLTRSSLSALTSRNLPRATPAVAQFSIMPALNSSAPPAGPREFDPEIRDMATYIHNYKIDSDLAVCISIG